MNWVITKLKTWNKGFCTWFWDTWFGVYIGDCCEKHDGDCSTKKFFNCIKEKFNGSKFHATYIAFFGSSGCWFKYPRWMIRKLNDKIR
jgi:hypothetical protein